MLHAVADLGEDGFGDIHRVLGDEPHGHALGADQTHDLLHLFEQCFRCVFKQQMRFVKEERDLRFVKVARLRQQLIQLGEHPEQKRAVKHRMLEQLGAFEDVHHAAAVVCPVEPVGDIERRFAEKQVAALVLECEQRALDGADGLRRNVAVADLIVVGVVRHKLQHGAQILEVE